MITIYFWVNSRFHLTTDSYQVLQLSITKYIINNIRMLTKKEKEKKFYVKRFWEKKEKKKLSKSHCKRHHSDLHN